MIAPACAKIAAKIRARHKDCTEHCRNKHITTEDIIEVTWAVKDLYPPDVWSS